MKKNYLSLLSIMFITLGLFFFSSCKKDPVVPTNETENKDHEDPAKAELLLVAGHLHGNYSFHQNPEYKEVKHLKRIQKITYELTPKGWGPTKDSPTQFRVGGTKRKDGYTVFGLWINYYNAKGELMTGQFIENGQDQIHQHFFIPRNVKPAFDGETEADDNDPSEIFDYVYCDSDPWNKSYQKEGAKRIGDKNPIGFKGFFKFKKIRKQFDLSIELMHAAKSKFNNGVASPYYKPSSAQKQRDHWDLKIRIPVTIYANSGEYIDEPESLKGLPEKDIPKNDMKLLKSIASAYGITWQEALEDIIRIDNSDTNPESGSLWF